MSDTQNGRLAHTGVNEITLTVADFSRRLEPLRLVAATLEGISPSSKTSPFWRMERRLCGTPKPWADADSTVRRYYTETLEPPKGGSGRRQRTGQKPYLEEAPRQIVNVIQSAAPTFENVRRGQFRASNLKR